MIHQLIHLHRGTHNPQLWFAICTCGHYELGRTSWQAMCQYAAHLDRVTAQAP